MKDQEHALRAQNIWTLVMWLEWEFLPRNKGACQGHNKTTYKPRPGTLYIEYHGYEQEEIFLYIRPENSSKQ